MNYPEIYRLAKAHNLYIVAMPGKDKNGERCTAYIVYRDVGGERGERLGRRNNLSGLEQFVKKLAKTS